MLECIEFNHVAPHHATPWRTRGAAPIEGRPDDAVLHMRELGDNVFYGG